MILHYSLENNITWNEDRSNSSTKYNRNLIRHQIIPELKKINPNLEETFASSMEKIQSVEKIYQNKVSEDKEKIIKQTSDGFGLNKNKIASLSEAKMVLYEILHEYGFNFEQVKDILLAINGQPGKTFYSQHSQLIIDREFLFVSPISEDNELKVLVHTNTNELKIHQAQLSFKKVNADEVTFAADQNTAFLDFDKLKFPLEIRFWREGDRFQPLGMKHKKKLSDFMIDEKIPLNLKQQVLVLTSGDEVIWVVGHRIDDRYKIASKTRRAFRISKKSIDDKSF
jgi:tRNA(Ile)-lysidine synthase